MTTRAWIGNAQAVAQVQTYFPGQQLPGTMIVATINGKTVSYTSTPGTNDDLVAGLAAAWSASQIAEFKEVTAAGAIFAPAVLPPNSTYLQLTSATPGTPFTVTIQLVQPANVVVTKLVEGKAGVNEVQQITISPNAESGSSFTLTDGGHTTNNIPTPPSPPSAAANGAGNLGASGAANYKWVTTFVTANGETEPSAASTTLSLNNQLASITSIALGPTGTTKRKLYRTKAGGSVFFLLTTINDNTTTTFSDNVADGSLGAESPPLTNGCLQGELEALTGYGQGTVKVGGANTAATVGMTMPTSPIVYTIEFVGSLGSASHALLSGSVANVTVLPTVSLTTVQTGCGPQNAIQVIGWQQVIGTLAPAGTFTMTLPGLGVTTGPILFNASAATVLTALVAAAGPAYQTAFAVSIASNTNAAGTWQITYQGPLALQAVPQAVVNVNNLSPAVGDTITGYQVQTQVGTPTGFNAQVTATLNNSPTGGTFGVTMSLANGNTATATGVAYNATAATLQAAFPANTIAATGSAGGPFTLEAIGEAAGQAVAWSATSSLTGGSSPAGSPAGSNTTGLAAPTGLALRGVFPSGTINGGLTPSTTYYYKVTATNAAGETLPSNELSVALTSAQNGISIEWNTVTGATGYKVYRGTSSGGENLLIATLTDNTSWSIGGGLQSFFDTGSTVTGTSPPGSNTAGISVPTFQIGASGNGVLTSGTTYYYKVTAFNGSGETTAAAEQSFTPGVSGEGATFFITPDSGATGYKIYRATSSGAETLVLTCSNPHTASNGYVMVADSGDSATSASPPGSNTTGLAAPVQTNPSTSSSGGNLASNTYYYEVTATDAVGETTASNEKSIVVTGPTGEVTVNWNAVTGATGYKIYRGTGTGAENAVAGQVFSGSTTSFLDLGIIPASLNITELAAGGAAVNAQQSISTVGATGGTFALGFEGQGTAQIPYNAAAATIQADLQALSTVGSGGFTVTGNNGGPWTVTAGGALAALDLPNIGASFQYLIGSNTVGAALTTVTSATGPNNWDNAANWSPSGVPVNGDNVYVQNCTVPIKYGLAQSAVTLAGLQVDMSFVGGNIGLPNQAKAGYAEYRQQYLQIGCSGNVVIGNGSGGGPTLLKFDFGTVAFSMLVNGCGNSADPSLPPILVKGNRASGSSEIDVTKGKLGVAMFAGETATIDIIRQSYQTNVNSDTYVNLGPGVTITTWFKDGGNGVLNGPITTLQQKDGTVTIVDNLANAPITTLTILGGTVNHQSKGTVTTVYVGSGATLDRSQDSRTVTFTNTTLYGKGSILDPHGSIIFTNPLTLVDCGLPDVTLDLGTNVTLARVQL